MKLRTKIATVVAALALAAGTAATASAVSSQRFQHGNHCGSQRVGSHSHPPHRGLKLGKSCNKTNHHSATNHNVVGDNDNENENDNENDENENENENENDAD